MPVVLLLVRTVGVAVAATWLVKEWRRVNAELDAVRGGAPQASDEPVTRLVNDPSHRPLPAGALAQSDLSQSKGPAGRPALYVSVYRDAIDLRRPLLAWPDTKIWAIKSGMVVSCGLSDDRRDRSCRLVRAGRRFVQATRGDLTVM